MPAQFIAHVFRQLPMWYRRSGRLLAAHWLIHAPACPELRIAPLAIMEGLPATVRVKAPTASRRDLRPLTRT